MSRDTERREFDSPELNHLRERQPAFSLLSASVADYYRAGGYEYGGPFEQQTGTGRAKCRECGRRIERGAATLVGYHDFLGSGSYTSVRIQLHANRSDCSR